MCIDNIDIHSGSFHLKAHGHDILLPILAAVEHLNLRRVINFDMVVPIIIPKM